MAAALATSFRQSPASTSTTESNVAARADLICACPLFAGIPRYACEEFARHARPKAFAREETLFMQGQPVRNIALIRTGSVKITQLAPNGNEVILWMYGAGNVVGALSEQFPTLHNCSGRAMEPCTALVWEREVLQDLVAQYPQVRNNISQILFSRLNELEERFREVATEKVAKRTALALLRLLKHVGKQVHGGVEISLSREELAQMTGTTLFTTSRILAHWGKMGYVLPRREAVLVRDARQLALAEEDDSFDSGPLVARRKSVTGRLGHRAIECLA